MEQAPFVMWSKRNYQGGSSHLKLANRNPRYDDSWEEQAFAEDALGTLGGCVWPPRSYSCSFCRREFRSAQALGGHMNVHRRDRARLKQSPVASNEVFDSEHGQDQASNQFQNNSGHVSLGLPYLPSLDCSTLGYNPNPNCDLLPFVSQPSPNPRVSTSLSDHGNNLTLNPFYFSPEVKENQTNPTIPSPHESWSNSATNRHWNVISRPITGENRNFKVVEDGEEEHDLIKDKIPLSLNMVIRACPDACINKEEVHSCKRRRVDDSSLRPLFFNEIQPEKMIDEFPSIREEDLDLELRLGGQPKKVKV